MSNKKAVDTSGINPEIERRTDAASPEVANRFSGALNGPVKEAVPAYNSTDSETVISGDNNSWIVLGRDRPGSKASGYGGKGHTQSGAIDLVVGRMGHAPKEDDGNGGLVFTDSNFVSDAARIYISQKTDIDNNFRIADGTVGNAISRSGIGIKADHLRFVAREGIKLVTKTDNKNSQGGDVKSVLGIDIIAGNDDTGLQPMAKGENLKEAIERLTNHVSKLNGIVDVLVMAQNQFNIALTHHFHISPFNGIPTSPSIPVVSSGTQTTITLLKDCKLSLMTNKTNLELFKANYLTPAGDGWILSRHNNVN